ncbi:hypothetical protein SLEP1_g48602 [Rubroshorea leprosula]|uniref:Uncharacterized protein n=1 Tax=Rubroshorea leprosula TaxID=152421 RepID=A0AAV5LWG4_9ROSI|nr:hypothetical protein SLEP1_g48602 [Rubroshorea leprosula]
MESSCGNIGEPGICGKCKQSGAVLVTVHALLPVKIRKQCHQFLGNCLPSGSAWRLFF